MKKNSKRITWQTTPDFCEWNRIKRLRQHLKIKQVELCRHSKISVPYLYQIESGLDSVSDDVKERITAFFSDRIGFTLAVSELFPTMVRGNAVIDTGEKLKIEVTG